MDKHCKDCGLDITGSHPNRKYCVPCRKKRKAAQDNTYRRRRWARDPEWHKKVYGYRRKWRASKGAKDGD